MVENGERYKIIKVETRGREWDVWVEVRDLKTWLSWFPNYTTVTIFPHRFRLHPRAIDALQAFNYANNFLKQYREFRPTEDNV